MLDCGRRPRYMRGLTDFVVCFYLLTININKCALFYQVSFWAGPGFKLEKSVAQIKISQLTQSYFLVAWSAFFSGAIQGRLKRHVVARYAEISKANNKQATQLHVLSIAQTTPRSGQIRRLLVAMVQLVHSVCFVRKGALISDSKKRRDSSYCWL